MALYRRCRLYIYSDGADFVEKVKAIYRRCRGEGFIQKVHTIYIQRVQAL